MKKKIPNFVKRCLWSYDTEKMDLLKDKELIITQVLNYGDEKGLKWLYQYYTDQDIKEVILKPGRGVWFKQALNFWTTMLNIKLKPEVWQKAIRDINPSFSNKKSLRS